MHMPFKDSQNIRIHCPAINVEHAQGPVEGFIEDSDLPDRSVTLGHRAG
jgi:hypothetical protein